MKRGRIIFEQLCRGRSWLLGCMLLSYLLLATGVPLPLGIGPWISGNLFPCQHHRCGCRSAEQCWRGCCCFTAPQKLAWARRNQVAVPEYVVVAANAECLLATANIDEPSAPQPGRTACEGHCGTSSTDAVSTQTASLTEETAPTEASAQTEPAVKLCLGWVVLQDANRCSGEAAAWRSLPPSVSPPQTFLVCYVEFGVGAADEAATPAPLSPSFAPPEPPPRVT